MMEVRVVVIAELTDLSRCFAYDLLALEASSQPFGKRCFCLCREAVNLHKNVGDSSQKKMSTHILRKLTPQAANVRA